MLKIGITGGIGSGKTTVAKVFELLDIPVFYADDIAKKLMVEDHVLIQQIKTEFGEEAYFSDLTLNRKYISNLVFNNSNQLEKLNSFVHPAVFRAFDVWYSQQNAPYVLKEAALLFETNSYKQNHFNILVSCPLLLRIERVMKRDLVTKEQVLKRIAAQLPEETKQALADFQVQNNEQEFIITQVLKIHEALIKKGETC
jgi:dephospho-CoA kinase